MRVRLARLLAVGAIAALSVITVRAGTVVSGGVTLTFPEYPVTGPALLSCEPWFVDAANSITLSGVPAGASVVVQFMWSPAFSGSPVYAAPITLTGDGGLLVVPVPYPSETLQWPVYDALTNERAIAMAVAVRVSSGSTLVARVSSKKWWIRCLALPRPNQGCTPGYWKQEHHFDSWYATGFNPTDTFNATFGVTSAFGDAFTLFDAVSQGGGGEKALGRQAVAALLNTVHADIAYGVADVIAGVQNAYATQSFEPFKDELDKANNAGCPLD
jgi:hypothetical protein